ncbi:MAG: Slp family lipoprotein [bacterium]|nr:Slp family lipoprotein [bacterium]
MKKQSRLLLLFLAAVALLIAGCAHVISSESRRLAAKNIPFQWIAQNPDRYKGIMVIWGGQIIETRNLPEGTLIVVLQRPLGRFEQPIEDSRPQGRFLVLYQGFLDPAVYEKGEMITVAGIIEGEKVMPLGEIEYRYPYLNAREIHLWMPDEMSQYYY